MRRGWFLGTGAVLLSAALAQADSSREFEARTQPGDYELRDVESVRLDDVRPPMGKRRPPETA